GLAQVTNPAVIPPINADPTTVLPEINGGARCEFKAAHTEWTDGQAHHTGITTAFTPNREVWGRSPSGARLEFDITGQREKKGGPTFAVVTARSMHPGGVNSLFGDGSVKFLKESIEGNVWRGLGTVSGGELISASDY
ncbi:MAG: H-X9-DG-CTERM domain-containing protein, partial [Isosphaeraceae bacterium]